MHALQQHVAFPIIVYTGTPLLMTLHAIVSSPRHLKGCLNIDMRVTLESIGLKFDGAQD